jgi:hypothetical protein
LSSFTGVEVKDRLFVLFSVLAFVASSLACAAFNRELGLSNPRMAFDQNGENITTTFAPTDVFYVVADLVNAPRGTRIDAKWIAVDVADTDPNSEFQTQTLDITDERFTGNIYFQLSNDAAWPVGQYRVDLYLNGTLAEGVEFSVE